MTIRQKQWIDAYIGIPLVYLHIVFAKLLGFLLKRNHSIDKSPKEIIIIKMMGLGSVVLATDVIFSIRQKYPQSRLSIVCSKSISEGIKALHLFDHLYIINDERLLQTIISSFRTLFVLWHLPNKWVFDFEVYSKLTTLFSLWTCAINRFGFYSNQVSFRYNLNTHNIFFNAGVHVHLNYTEMAMAAGVNHIQPFLIGGYIQQQPTTQFIAINNTCSDLAPERKLTTSQVILLCDLILSQTGKDIALLGAPDDFNTQESIRLAIRQHDRIRNCAGKFTFSDYFSFLVNECIALITIDSAPLHIANKLGVPTISLWGPTSPDHLLASSSTNTFLYNRIHCSPCVHVTDVLPCGGDNVCMKHLDMQMVFQELCQIAGIKL